MNFTRRKIRSGRLAQFSEKQKSARPRIVIPTRTIALILTIIIALGLLFSAYRILKSMSLKNVIFSFGKNLAQDDYNHTNILLLGTGGGIHEGADLTDTIMVASIDQNTNQVTLLSIPRDLYIDNKTGGGTRINNLYSIGKNDLKNEELGMTMIREEVEKVTGIPIQYYIKVDFSGFEKLVDDLGGIDLYAPYPIYDTQYPKGETGYYETFSIGAGFQHLDGTTALKYARSRHSTSDFDRSRRQHLILQAIKEKAEQKGILTSAGAINDLYDTLKPYFITDLSARELITLAKIGTNIKTENIANYMVHDDPTQCGGLLYVPAKELYGGASVLVTANKGFKDIQTMANIVVNHPELRSGNVTLQILNGTRGIGIAAETKMILNRLCLKVSRFGNGQAKDIAQTTYYVKQTVPDAALKILQSLIPGAVTNQVPQKYIDPPYASDATIVLEIGSDYLPNKMRDPFDYIVPLKPAEPISGEAAGTTAAETSTSTANKKTK